MNGEAFSARQLSTPIVLRGVLQPGRGSFAAAHLCDAARHRWAPFAV